jgi:hypothetical protein
MTIADRLNALYTRLRAALISRSRISARYDNVHRAVLDELDSIRDDEWERSVSIFGKRQTILELFLGIAHHFEEHAARIRPVINTEMATRGRESPSEQPR